MDWIVLLLGLVVLLGGGDALVRGATSLSRAFGVPPLVIGMTVVAFGTSAPELAVNVASALKGSGEITFGNVVGSNIANIGLILGLAALFSPLDIHPSIVTREIPVMLCATLGMVLLGSFGPVAVASSFGRVDGVLLLIGFVAFLGYTIRTTLRSKSDLVVKLASKDVERHRFIRSIPAALLLVAGLVGVLLGSHWTVEGATAVAESLGISQAVIGLTIVAVGTSLPELTASIFSALKGQADLAIGNVVGSNIFNMLFVLGVSSVVRPVPVPKPGGNFDFVALAAFSVILLPFARSQRRLSRVEGALMFLAYIGYMTWRTLS